MIYVFISLLLAGVFAAISLDWREFDNGKTTAIVSALIFFFGGLINYFAMPVLNLWGYYAIWAELLIVTFIGAIVGSISGDDYAGYDWVPEKAWRFIFPVVICVFMISAALISSAAFNAGEYQQKLQVQEVSFDNFSSDVNVIPVEKMVVADDSIARKVVEDRLEEDPGLGSRCVVGKMTMQQITGEFVIDGGKKLVFNNDIVWVAPLEHSSFYKWLVNDVTPGYMLVYANDPTRTYLITEINGEKIALRYIESGCFGDDIERRIRTHGYRSQGITEHNFEIDSNGRPHWVLCSYKPTISFGCKDADGCIVVDAQTGAVNGYAINEAPDWIDHIQPAEFVSRQIGWWGKYKNGWLNSWIAQRDVQEPTPGMVLVYSEEQTFWYTGVRSAGGDAATSGFMLINARTKEARYYRVSGVNEQEAKKIAEDQNFAKAANYNATSPVLYNVRGVPTYFMTLRGESGNVMGYAFVAVTNRQAVGVGSSKKEAESNYLQALKRTSNDTLNDSMVLAVEVKNYTVRDITFEGSTYYILFKEVKGKEFSGSSEFFRELKWTKSGDLVCVTYSETNSDLVILDSFDNLGFEF